MTRMIRGSVLLAACVGMWSCSSDPTADEAGVPYKIVSLPSIIFVKQDSAQLISFQLVDELDGQIPETWTFTNTSPNFTVSMDSSYRPVYNSDGTLSLPEEQTEVRVTITGTALGISNFTASAGGKSLVVPINVVPGTLYATFSPSNPAPGDTVTMTMPGTLRLADTSKVTFPGNVAPIIVDRAVDGTSLRFINAPSTDTTAVVTAVSNLEFPTITPVTLTSQTKVTGTASGTWTGDLPATISPLVAGQIVVTLNPAYAFKTSVPASEFSFPGQTAPIVAGISTDSTVATLDVGPNVDSPLQVTRITFKGAPQFEYTLVSEENVVSPVISSFGATLSNATPQIGEPITLTAGVGFSFNSALGTVSWPLVPNAIVTGRTANTITLYPYPASAGNAVVSGVVPASAPAFQLTLPTVLTTPLAMQATVAPGLAGTNDYGTAPFIAAQGVIDAVSLAVPSAQCNSATACQIYQLSVAAAGTVAFTMTWNSTKDLGLYFLDSGLNFLTTNVDVYGCDLHGGGATASPETCTVTFPAAGDYYLEVGGYGALPMPTWLAIRF